MAGLGLDGGLVGPVTAARLKTARPKPAAASERRSRFDDAKAERAPPVHDAPKDRKQRSGERSGEGSDSVRPYLGLDRDRKPDEPGTPDQP